MENNKEKPCGCGGKDNKNHKFAPSNILFVNEEDLKRDSYIDDNVSPDRIRVAILHIQTMIIERVTGSCLADYIRELICNDEIGYECNLWYRELLDTYLFPIFVYGVPAEISIPSSYQDRNSGRVKLNDDSYTQSALSELKYTNQWYKDKVDFYVSRAVDFLRCNKDNFCHISCCKPCGCSVAPFNKDSSLGLNLGSVYNPYKIGRRT